MHRYDMSIAYAEICSYVMCGFFNAWNCRDLNPQPVDRMSYALTTIPLRHSALWVRTSRHN